MQLHNRKLNYENANVIDGKHMLNTAYSNGISIISKVNMYMVRFDCLGHYTSVTL